MAGVDSHIPVKSNWDGHEYMRAVRQVTNAESAPVSVLEDVVQLDLGATTVVLLTSAGSTTQAVALPPAGTLNLHVSGTFVGTLTTRGSADGGATFFNLGLHHRGSGDPIGATLSAAGDYLVDVHALTHLQVVSVLSSGTVSASATVWPGTYTSHIAFASDVSVAGTLAALNAVVAVRLSGRQSASMQLTPSSLTATATPVTSIDMGATWQSTVFLDRTTGVPVDAQGLSASSTVLNYGVAVPDGSTHVGVQLSAYTSGTATVVVTASAVAPLPPRGQLPSAKSLSVVMASDATFAVASGVAVALLSPPTNLTATADTALTFSSQVRHVRVQNNTTTSKWLNFDAAAGNGLLVFLQPGQLFSDDIPLTVLHIWSSAADPVNAAAGVAVWGYA